MAERIDYDVKPTPIGPTASEEMQRLIEGLHEAGVLRFANDVVRARTGVAQVVVDGLNQEGSLNALQNLSTLFMALSRIEPEQFYKVVFALKDAAAELGNQHPGDDEAPGVTGAYKMLHDDELWAAVGPIVAALKAFARGMDKPAEAPVTRFTGKETEM